MKATKSEFPGLTGSFPWAWQQRNTPSSSVGGLPAQIGGDLYACCGLSTCAYATNQPECAIRSSAAAGLSPQLIFPSHPFSTKPESHPSQASSSYYILKESSSVSLLILGLELIFIFTSIEYYFKYFSLEFMELHLIDLLLLIIFRLIIFLSAFMVHIFLGITIFLVVSSAGDVCLF